VIRTRIPRNPGELAARRKRRGLNRPVIEAQTISFPHNSARIPEITRLVAEPGADLQTIRGDNRDEDAERCTLRECPYAWGSLFISWDGRIYPCMNRHHFVSDRRHGPAGSEPEETSDAGGAETGR
jgi:hypothetical protein